MQTLRFGLMVMILSLCVGCAKTVSSPIESPYKLRFRVTFAGTIDTSRYHYFFLVGNNQSPDRNPDYLSVPMYVPGYRPGEISEHEIFLRSDDSDETEAQNLASNTTYLSTWSDIITFASSTSEFQRCNGPFSTPTSFLALEELCSGIWRVGGSVISSSSSNTTMGFEVQIDALANGSNELDSLQIAVLTLDNILPENFTFSLPTLVDFASDDEGVALVDVQTKTNEISLYESTCSQVDQSKRAACVSSIHYVRTR